MKVFVVIFLCLFLTLGIFAQTEETETKIVKLTLAKEDNEGNIIEDPEFFDIKDIPLYCYIDLNTDKPTLVRMKILAVKAKGLRPNAQIVQTRYKTKSGENGVTFTAKPGKVWQEGEYRVEIYLDSVLKEKKNFVVKTIAKE